MKRIVVGSMDHAREFRPQPGERYAVLSFVDVGGEVVQLERMPGFVERLVVHADDCTPRNAHSADPLRVLTPLSERQAQQVARFVRANAERVDTLFVHCHAGLSRSPAAAAAIAEALAIADVVMRNEATFPNEHVRELVARALR